MFCYSLESLYNWCGYSNDTGHVLVKYGHVLTHTGHVLVQGQIPLDCFWSRLDMFWTTHKICFYKFYKKGALTFEFEKKRNAALFRMIYLNSWAKNIHGIQHFLIQPWTGLGSPRSCFEPFISKGVHVDHY